MLSGSKKADRKVRCLLRQCLRAPRTRLVLGHMIECCCRCRTNVLSTDATTAAAAAGAGSSNADGTDVGVVAAAAAGDNREGDADVPELPPPERGVSFMEALSGGGRRYMDAKRGKKRGKKRGRSDKTPQVVQK